MFRESGICPVWWSYRADCLEEAYHELMLDLFFIETGQILKVLVEQMLAGYVPWLLGSFLSPWPAPSWCLWYRP